MKLVISENAFIRKNSIVRESLRRLLTSFSVYQSGDEKDILLLSARRSGSTWLMECLGGEPRLRSLNEPFGPKFIEGSPLAEDPDFARIYSGHRLFEFTGGICKQVECYMRDPVKSRLSGPYNPLSPSFHLRYDRSLWKVIHANPAIEFFYNKAEGFHTILLLRHPCPTILSMQKKYEPELALILENEAFCQKHLDAAQLASLQEIDRSGSLLEKFAAEWALEQLVPMQLLPKYKDRLLVLSYEALLSDPVQVIRRICKYCRLTAEESIVNALSYPSASTAGDRLEVLRSSSSDTLLRGWRQKMTTAEERRVFEIIEMLGIHSYSFGRDEANPGFCEFSEN